MFARSSGPIFALVGLALLSLSAAHASFVSWGHGQEDQEQANDLAEQDPAGQDPTESDPTQEDLSSPFTISEATTRLTAPLTEEGFIDYSAAINAISGEGVTPENNAEVLYLEAMGFGATGLCFDCL